MFYAILKTIHLLSIIVWIGGMVFAHFFLRPAVAMLSAAPPCTMTNRESVLKPFGNA